MITIKYPKEEKEVQMEAPINTSSFVIFCKIQLHFKLFEQDIVVYNGDNPILNEQLVTIEPGTVLIVMNKYEAQYEFEPLPKTYLEKLTSTQQIQEKSIKYQPAENIEKDLSHYATSPNECRCGKCHHNFKTSKYSIPKKHNFNLVIMDSYTYDVSKAQKDDIMSKLYQFKNDELIAPFCTSASAFSTEVISAYEDSIKVPITQHLDFTQLSLLLFCVTNINNYQLLMEECNLHQFNSEEQRLLIFEQLKQHQLKHVMLFSRKLATDDIELHLASRDLEMFDAFIKLKPQFEEIVDLVEWQQKLFAIYQQSTQLKKEIGLLVQCFNLNKKTQAQSTTQMLVIFAKQMNRITLVTQLSKAPHKLQVIMDSYQPEVKKVEVKKEVKVGQAEQPKKRFVVVEYTKPESVQSESNFQKEAEGMKAEQNLIQNPKQIKDQTPYLKQLEELKEVGFDVDEQTLVQLLNKFEGDIDKVLDELQNQ